MKYLLVFLLLCFAPTVRAEERCGRWVEVQEGKQIWERHYFSPEYSFIEKGYWFLLSGSLPRPDSVWVPEICSELQGLGIRDLGLAPSSQSQAPALEGFWEYTYPLFTPSGDTFIVTMQDSLWMTGERPKTETLWHDWEPWGWWWFLRPEVEKEERSLQDSGFIPIGTGQGHGIHITKGDWYLQYKQAQLSYGTKDGWRSDTITIRIRLDTLWQVAESVYIEKDQGKWLYPEFHIKEE